MTDDPGITGPVGRPAGDPGDRDSEAGSLLLLAVWFGLLTGFAEVAYLLFQGFVRHAFVWRGQQALWMIPLAEALLFLLAGGGLLLAGWLVPRLRSLPVAIAVFVTLSVLSVLGPIRPGGLLHPVSLLLLSAGLGAVTARLAARRARFLGRFVRWSTPLLVGLLLALSAALNLYLAARERAALATLPAPAGGAPNVLLIVLDTVRAANLSLYGYERPTTPHLERFARRGVRFDHAIAPSSWTLPSHATLFTGRHPHEHHADWGGPLDDTYPTLAEFLARQGYRTAGVVANVNFTSWETGLARGFAHYEDYGTMPLELLQNSSLTRRITRNPFLRRIVGTDQLLTRKDAAEVNHAFLRWLGEDPERPFFAFLNYFDAHDPYLPPAPFDSRFAAGEPRGGISPLHRHERIGGPPPTAAELRAEMDAYDGAIGYLDDQLGRLFAELERRGVLDNTLVIITSDHGEEFAEHRVAGHGDSLYLPSLHIPLIFAYPRALPAGATVHEPVSLQNLPATIAMLLGYPGDSPFDTPPLPHLPALRARAETAAGGAVLSELSHSPGNPAWFPTSRGDMSSLVADSLHYILNGDGQEELYDFINDRWEQTDLARTPNGRETLPTLRRMLTRKLDNAPPLVTGTRPRRIDRR